MKVCSGLGAWWRIIEVHSTSYTPSWSRTFILQSTTPTYKTYGSRPITARQKKWEDGHWVQLINTDCARNILCQKLFGMARKPSTVSRRRVAMRWKIVTQGTDTQRQMRRKHLPRKLDSRWLKCLTGSKIGDNGTGHHKLDRKCQDKQHVFVIRRFDVIQACRFPTCKRNIQLWNFV